MRFLSLQLERFGAFEGLRLAFRPGRGCMSSTGRTSRKIDGASGRWRTAPWLPPKPRGQAHPFAFRFGETDLRVGADIVAARRPRLSFRRRKGCKNTLLDSSVASARRRACALPWRCWRGCLSRARSGSTRISLREGGARCSMQRRSWCEPDGGGLRPARSQPICADPRRRGRTHLRARAGKDRRFYQAFERFNAARAAIREKELRSDPG